MSIVYFLRTCSAVHFPPVSLFLWKNISSFAFSKLYIFFKRYTLKTIPVSFCLLWMAIFHFLSFHRDTFSRKSIQKAFHCVPSSFQVSERSMEPFRSGSFPAFVPAARYDANYLIAWFSGPQKSFIKTNSRSHKRSRANTATAS